MAQSAHGFFNYLTGRKGVIALGYDSALIDKIPDDALNSFCGVGNPLAISTILPGSKILDIGCGSGVDLLVAREVVGQNGHVCGIDLTEEMVNNTQLLIKGTGYENISVQHVTSEKIPYNDKRFDYVISNGVFNLSPSKLELFREIRRVMKPGGILQFADVCLQEGKVLEQSSSPDDWAQ